MLCLRCCLDFSLAVSGGYSLVVAAFLAREHELSGLQVGLYNSATQADLLGFQVGLWNEAGSFRGFQVGLVNTVGVAQGFQVGVINRAEEMYGFQVGVINVIRDAELTFCPLVNIGF